MINGIRSVEWFGSYQADETVSRGFNFLAEFHLWNITNKIHINSKHVLTLYMIISFN